MRLQNGVGTVMNGLDLNGVDEFGVSWKTNEIPNWPARSGSTGDTIQNPYDDYGTSTPAFATPMAYNIVGRAFAPSRAAALAAIDRFNAAIPFRVRGPLAVQMDGITRHRLVRLEDQNPKVNLVTDRLMQYDIQVSAPDARQFAGDGTTASSGSVRLFLPFASSGFAPPLTPPFAIAAVVISGSSIVHSSGSATPRASARFTGPLDHPVLRTSDGQFLKLDLIIPAGQFVDVDFDKRTTKINGLVDRSGDLLGDYLLIPPGVDLTVALTVDSYNPDGFVDLTWLDAWL